MSLGSHLERVECWMSGSVALVARELGTWLQLLPTQEKYDFPFPFPFPFPFRIPLIPLFMGAHFQVTWL